MIWSFSKLLLYGNIPISNNSPKMSEIDKSFDILEFLRSILSYFPHILKWNLQIIFWMPTGLCVQSLLNVCQHSDSKTINKITTCTKTKMLVFRLLWSHSEVSLKQNTAMFSSKNVLHSSFFRCWFDSVSENVQKLHQKLQYFRQQFRSIWGIFLSQIELIS